MTKSYSFILIVLCCILILSGCSLSPRSPEEVFHKQPSSSNLPELETEPATEEKETQKKDNAAPTKEPQMPQESEDAPVIETEENTIEYEDYTGEIPHIFTHCLIAYPEIKADNGYMLYDSDCITVTEYKRILKQLYDNGYSLISIEDAYYQDKDGAMHLSSSVRVPKGRKPFIFSIDDMVYDIDKKGSGMADFLDLDDQNQIVAGTYEEDGSISYSYDNECIPILEDFIKEHPEFSSQGARLTLCMTGFTGQFGYRTDHHFKGDAASEKAKAKKIARRLKELGYTFASHSYGHYDLTKLKFTQLEDELRLFKEEVTPIIGDTNIFVYPYGKLIKPDDEKYQLLLDYGFRIFCSVSHFFFLRDYDEGHSIYMTRISLDGYSLRNYKSALSPLFDTDSVIDRKNRP